MYTSNWDGLDVMAKHDRHENGTGGQTSSIVLYYKNVLSNIHTEVKLKLKSKNIPVSCRPPTRRTWRTGWRRCTLRAPLCWQNARGGRTHCVSSAVRPARCCTRSTWTERWRRWPSCSCLSSRSTRTGRPWRARSVCDSVYSGLKAGPVLPMKQAVKSDCAIKVIRGSW